MNYLDAVAAFIKQEYKTDELSSIEISCRSKNNGYVTINKDQEAYMGENLYFFQPEEMYEAPDFLDFEYTVQLEDGNYVFWQED